MRNPDLDERLADWMVRYQNGDTLAFDDLYCELKPRLLRYMQGRLSDRARAEDLVQETLLQIHRSRNTYRPGNPVLPWVFGIARHIWLMEARSSARRARHEAEQSDAGLPEIPVVGEAEGFGDRDAVRRAFAMLPEDRREALLLHYLAGLTFKEIASVQGIGEEAAKLRAHRAIHTLRYYFEKLVTKTVEKQKIAKKEATSEGTKT
jgi:RNA polymerase sigma-70 factor (ECF subfamily)